MKKLDTIIVITILVLSGILLAITKFNEINIKKNNNTLYAHVYVKNKLYKVVNVSENHSESVEIKTDLGNNIIKIHDNGVEIVEADCDDHICEKTGFLNKAGGIIVCLPNQVVIEIKGPEEAALDGTSK